MKDIMYRFDKSQRRKNKKFTSDISQTNCRKPNGKVLNTKANQPGVARAVQAQGRQSGCLLRWAVNQDTCQSRLDTWARGRWAVRSGWATWPGVLTVTDQLGVSELLLNLP